MSKDRNEVAANLKWDLTKIIKDEKEFDAIEKEILGKLDFSAFEGKLSDENVLLECLRYMDAVETKLEKLAVYAMMYRDIDTRNSAANALNSRVDNLFVKYSSAISFVTPEITSLPEEKLRAIISDVKFKDYDYQLKQLLKAKPHVLSKESENVLSLGGQVFGGFQEIFTMINNADLPFPEIEVADEKTPENASDTVENQIREKEAERILMRLDKEAKEGAYVFALAIDGREFDSVELSKKIENLGTSGISQIVFLIGGSLGMSENLLKRADCKLSFSKMTFPHQLMRVILLEQVYRSYRIMNGEPYHK